MSDKQVHLQPDNIIALWRNRAYTTVHPMPTGDDLDRLVAAGSYPKFPAVPQYFEAMDAADFIFTFRVIPDSKKGEAGWIWFHPAFGSSPKEFTTLVAACEDAYWHHSGLAEDIAQLKSGGVEVLPGIEGTSYWCNRLDNQISPLYPTVEAAWRAAIRELFPTSPLEQRGGLIKTMKNALEVAGYSFFHQDGQVGWRSKSGVTAHSALWGMDQAVKDACSHWHSPLHLSCTSADEARTDAADFSATPTADLQGCKKALELVGYTFREGEWESPTGAFEQSTSWTQEQLIEDAWKHCVSQGTDEEVLAYVAKGFEATEAFRKGMLEGRLSPKAREMAKDLVHSRSVFPNIAPGEPYPAVRTDVVVTPHNVNWGFSKVDDYLCTVLAYDGDYVWLRVAHYDGPHSGSRISTRVDKVDFRPSEEQP